MTIQDDAMELKNKGAEALGKGVKRTKAYLRKNGIRSAADAGVKAGESVRAGATYAGRGLGGVAEAAGGFARGVAPEMAGAAGSVANGTKGLAGGAWNLAKGGARLAAGPGLVAELSLHSPDAGEGSDIVTSAMRNLPPLKDTASPAATPTPTPTSTALTAPVGGTPTAPSLTDTGGTGPSPVTPSKGLGAGLTNIQRSTEDGVPSFSAVDSSAPVTAAPGGMTLVDALTPEKAAKISAANADLDEYRKAASLGMTQDEYKTFQAKKDFDSQVQGLRQNGLSAGRAAATIEARQRDAATNALKEKEIAGNQALEQARINNVAALNQANIAHLGSLDTQAASENAFMQGLRSRQEDRATKEADATGVLRGLQARQLQESLDSGLSPQQEALVKASKLATENPALAELGGLQDIQAGNLNSPLAQLTGAAVQNQLFEKGDADAGLIESVFNTLNPFQWSGKRGLKQYLQARGGVAPNPAANFSDITEDSSGYIYAKQANGVPIRIGSKNLLDPKTRAAFDALMKARGATPQ